VRTANDKGAPIRIVEAVVAVNDARKKSMAGRVAKALGGSVSGKTVALLGLTFKPNTDDMRDSASLDIVPALLNDGAKVQVFDPEGMKEAKKLLSGPIVWCNSAAEAMGGADALVIITEWNEFRSLNLEEVKRLLRQPVIVDFRNIYSPAEMAAAGIRYTCLGRPSNAV
jgi:UDPglucose 6-dehydrogenase